jgi:hypothetical protein
MANEQTAQPPTPEMKGVGSKEWLDAIENHITDRKYMEQKYRRESDDARLKADVVHAELMVLEHALYKAKLRG